MGFTPAPANTPAQRVQHRMRQLRLHKTSDLYVAWLGLIRGRGRTSRTRSPDPLMDVSRQAWRLAELDWKADLARDVERECLPSSLLAEL